MTSLPTWHPASWRGKTALQQANYPDEAAAERVVEELSRLPPLVTSWEVEELKAELARASRGETFVLQGGDCAESFVDCSPDGITSKLKILLQMSLVLMHATRKPVVRVGRLAGQYAKPRSADTETRDGVTLPSYRGDMVNRSGFTDADRTPDPSLMLRGYERAALTLNFIRALSSGGFADLHHPEYWDLSFVESSPRRDQYEAIVADLHRSIAFTEVVTGRRFDQDARWVKIFTSHEGLVLPYEQAQTRTVPRREGFYDLSTHFPWIGMRTAQLDGAHVEYFRGIQNPIAVKVGPGMTQEWLTELVEVLNPHDEPGRLALTVRLGASRVRELLPPLVEAVEQSGRTVLWMCDPMHGNTEKLTNGVKTRRFDAILEEVSATVEIHRAMGTILGGVHFEMTGDDVTECIGGSGNLTEADLDRAYRSTVDPRLNHDQALEMAMLLGHALAER